MKARLSEMLQGLQLQQNNVTITFTEIEKVDGEMTAMNRKGKTYEILLASNLNQSVVIHHLGFMCMISQ